MNFLEIVKFLAQANVLDKKIIPYLTIRIVLIILIGAYFIFIMHIYFSVFVDIPWFSFSRVIEIQNLIIGFSALVFISLLLLITYKAEKIIIEIEKITNDEERVLWTIFNEPHLDKNSIVEKIKKEYGRDKVDNNIFNKLKTTKAQTIGFIREKEGLGPLIHEENGKFTLTSNGLMYCMKKITYENENLIESKGWEIVNFKIPNSSGSYKTIAKGKGKELNIGIDRSSNYFGKLYVYPDEQLELDLFQSSNNGGSKENLSFKIQNIFKQLP